jgi:flagellar hook-basal body complex protein FliE
MAVLPAAAAAAYQSISQMGSSTATSAGVSSAAETGAGGFGQFLSDAMKDSIETMKHGEKMAGAGMAGKADIVDVVNAVNQAEITLDTVVAVRDKVVSAYQSIMNMPI